MLNYSKVYMFKMRKESSLSISMATIRMPMLVPNKPNIYPFSTTKTLKPRCCVSSTSSAATSLTHCSLQTSDEHCDQCPIQRRSGNYKPTLWDFEYIQSLNSEYSEEKYLTRASELKEQVNMMLDCAMKPTDLLEFIDDLQQIGISYHFEDKIKQILTRIYNQKYLKNVLPKESDDLYTTALEFRLLRQHGFIVPQEIFNCFKNEKGEFKSSLGNDTKGLLQLYEASYMLTEDENTLEMAREFATSFLQNSLYNHDHGFGQMDESLSLMVRSALELPLHWKVQRPNARWFIYAYEKRPGSNPVVLEFAKLDFNIVQATLRDELKHVSRWWKKTCLAEKLPFARDRLVECYSWTTATGVISDPQQVFSRIMVTKVNALITTIDDVYDVYGTLEELQLFTDVIQRWDIKAIDQLPKYMQLCYLALDNFINDMAYDVLKDQGFVIIPYLRKSWTDLCEAYLKEAQWYFQGYTPTIEEYMENAWISISAPTILTHVFFAVTNPIKEDAVQDLYKYHDIVRWSSIILRLADDLGTSTDEMERGDVSKLAQCYMNETGGTEKDAQEHARFLIRETWKKMNKERVGESPFPQSFIKNAVDLGRMAQYIYQYGDGHGISNQQTQYRISSLLFELIT